MDEKYTKARGAGGYYVHLVDRETRRAICGYKPSSPRGRLFRRGRWLNPYHADSLVSCPNCQAKIVKLNLEN